MLFQGHDPSPLFVLPCFKRYPELIKCSCHSKSKRVPFSNASCLIFWASEGSKKVPSIKSNRISTHSVNQGVDKPQLILISCEISMFDLQKVFFFVTPIHHRGRKCPPKPYHHFKGRFAVGFGWGYNFGWGSGSESRSYLKNNSTGASFLHPKFSTFI